MKSFYIILIATIILLTGCSSTLRDQSVLDNENTQSTYQDTEQTQAQDNTEIIDNENHTLDVLTEQKMAEVYRAEEYFGYGVQANADSKWKEAQYNFEKAINILADLDIDPDEISSVSYNYKTLLNEIRTEYKLTLLYLATIPGETSSSVFIERFSEIDDFNKLKTEEVTTDVDQQLEYDIPIVINKQVENSIIYFQTVSKDFFQAALTRSGAYIPIMEEILKEENVPLDLIYLPLIESGFKTNAYSWAHAMGPWQFISSTGREYNLNRNWWYDERRDFVKSTRAAARYLKWLHSRYDDWYLALASYNGGPGRVDRAVKKIGARDFWKIQKKLKRETRNYVPLYLAATIIAKNPEKYGFKPYYDKGLEYSTVKINKSLDLRDVAKELGTTYKYLKKLNPEILRKFTPPNMKDYRLRIPVETETKFWAVYKKLKSPKETTWVRHKIRKGQTLSSIAKKYGVSVWAIVDANNIKNRHRLIAGKTILVPAPGKSYSGSSKKKSNKSYTAKGNKYRVKRGDTLWEIAEGFGTSVASLRKYNDIPRRGKIYPGQVLQISSSKSNTKSKSSNKATSTYKIRRGDTLEKIARKYSTTISNLKKMNNIRNASRIQIGQLLKVPSKAKSNSGKSSGVNVYVVKAGDTLWEIAKAFSCSVNDIVRLNKLKSHRIKIGDRLKVGRG